MWSVLLTWSGPEAEQPAGDPEDLQRDGSKKALEIVNEALHDAEEKSVMNATADCILTDSHSVEQVAYRPHGGYVHWSSPGILA